MCQWNKIKDSLPVNRLHSIRKQSEPGATDMHDVFFFLEIHKIKRQQRAVLNTHTENASTAGAAVMVNRGCNLVSELVPILA